MARGSLVKGHPSRPTMTLYANDTTTGNDEMNALLHAMLQAETCDLETIALVLDRQEEGASPR